MNNVKPGEAHVATPSATDPANTNAAPQTPGAKWRENGDPDPHGSRYECERATLCRGNMTDDELANAVFMHGDEKPRIEDVINGKAKMPIAYLTAAKDRIRWLSRKLAEANERASTVTPA